MIFQIFLATFFAHFSLAQNASTGNCCSFDPCSIDKVALVGQLMQLALEIQGTVKNDCSVENISNPTTIATTTTTTTTTPASETTTAATLAPVTTTTLVPETTTTTTTTTLAPVPATRFFIPEGNGNYTYDESLAKCQTLGVGIYKYPPPVLIETRAKFEELQNFLRTTPLEGVYFWTSGMRGEICIPGPCQWAWRTTGGRVDLTQFENTIRENSNWNQLLLVASAAGVHVVNYDKNLRFAENGQNINMLCQYY